MSNSIRTKLLQVDLVRKGWSWYRNRCVLAKYYEFVDKYGGWRIEDGSSATFQTSIADEVRQKLGARGAPHPTREDCHTLIMTLTDSWGQGMVCELEAFGPVTVFDWWKAGFVGWGPAFQRKVPELNERFFEFVRNTHARRPIDWVLITCNGAIILRSTIRRIKEDLGVPIVNQWLDCVHTFELGQGPHGQDLGQCDIAPDFDLVCTSSRTACSWYRAVGATPLFLPEGFSPTLTPRLERPKTADVAFVGACYGQRPDYVAALRKAGLRVVVAGSGWGRGSIVPRDDMGEFLASARMVLGIGGVGYSMQLTTLKGRDFEVPGAGCTYLTTFNGDLADLFHVGKEILCYQSIDEMVDISRRVVRYPEYREVIAACAYEKSMASHRWRHRFEAIFKVLGWKPRTVPEIPAT